MQEKIKDNTISRQAEIALANSLKDDPPDDERMVDAVSRDSVKFLLCKETCHPGAFCPDGFCREICEKVDALPSATPKQRMGEWIPVSERLPEDGTDCLVSVRCSKKVVVVDMATYSTDLFTVDKEDFFGNRGESGWYYLSREYGYCKVLNVIAWMPLPEPYAERRIDE